MTIFNPDDGDVSEIVLPDGSQASKVVAPDGSVVWSAGGEIPDSEDLHAHWDVTQEGFSDGGTVSSISDQSGNGNSLDAVGNPQAVTNAIGGNTVVRTDGVDDYLESLFGNLSQPFSIFIVGKQNESSGFAEFWTNPGSTTNYFADSGSSWFLFTGNTSQGGAASQDTAAHVFSHLLKSTDEGYLDGTQDISGDSGSRDLDGGIRFGAVRGDNPDRFLSIDIGEVLVYPMDKSDIRSDVEQYLNDKWSVY